MFEGFSLDFIDLPDARLRVRHGGSGPPLLLLHGHPRTHTTWHRVAPLLAEHFTVICPDLRGFGQSSKPSSDNGHKASAKREKAKDCIALMQKFGFERFALAGHDRGAYTAFRTAMDHPAAISKLAILDAVPIIEALDRCNAKFAEAWYHWFFFMQEQKPERAILADPLAWYGGDPVRMGEGNYADFVNAVTDPKVVSGMLGDYRAGLHMDRAHDDADRAAGRTLQCPLLCLWSLDDDLEELYGDVRAVWAPWASDISGFGIKSGHHMAEDAPEELAAALIEFLGE